jgi:ABC-type polysaccharide/polyol phosphate export permease
MPDMKALGIVALISIALCMVGYAVFKKLEKGFAEQF